MSVSCSTLRNQSIMKPAELDGGSTSQSYLWMGWIHLRPLLHQEHLWICLGTYGSYSSWQFIVYSWYKNTLNGASVCVQNQLQIIRGCCPWEAIAMHWCMSTSFPMSTDGCYATSSTFEWRYITTCIWNHSGIIWRCLGKRWSTAPLIIPIVSIISILVDHLLLTKHHWNILFALSASFDLLEMLDMVGVEDKTIFQLSS